MSSRSARVIEPRGLMSGPPAANRPLFAGEFTDVIGFDSCLYASIVSPALRISNQTEQQIQRLIKTPLSMKVTDVFDEVLKTADKELESAENAIRKFRPEAVRGLWWSLTRAAAEMIGTGDD